MPDLGRGRHYPTNVAGDRSTAVLTLKQKEEATPKLPLRVASKIPVPWPRHRHPNEVGGIIIRADPRWIVAVSVRLRSKLFFNRTDVCEVF
jgi:hypothetical protein